jgi:hypothetical protein
MIIYQRHAIGPAQKCFGPIPHGSARQPTWLYPPFRLAVILAAMAKCADCAGLLPFSGN